MLDPASISGANGSALATEPTATVATRAMYQVANFIGNSPLTSPHPRRTLRLYPPTNAVNRPLIHFRKFSHAARLTASARPAAGTGPAASSRAGTRCGRSCRTAGAPPAQARREPAGPCGAPRPRLLVRFRGHTGPEMLRLRLSGLTKAGILPRSDHSGLMLANFTPLAHFSDSSAISLPKSEGEATKIDEPRVASRAFNLGSARPALISLLRMAIISAGVFFGAPMP